MSVKILTNEHFFHKLHKFRQKNARLNPPDSVYFSLFLNRSLSEIVHTSLKRHTRSPEESSMSDMVYAALISPIAI